MQTLDKSTSPASTPTKSLAARMGAILSWCKKRQIGQVYAFFRGCDTSIEPHEARIRLVIRTSHHTVTEADLPWIESMEAIVDALPKQRNLKAVA